MDKTEIIYPEDGNTVTEFATHDPEREEQNKINAKNAELLFNVEFIPYYLGIKRQHNLSDIETQIYGFIRFFTGGGKDFFVSNARIAAELSCHEMTVSKAIKTLSTCGLIEATCKTTPTGTVRKLSVIGVSPTTKGGKSQDLGGLAPRLRGVSPTTELYIPSNTYQVSNNNLTLRGKKKFIKMEAVGKDRLYKRLAEFQRRLGREPSKTEYRNIMEKLSNAS